MRPGIRQQSPREHTGHEEQDRQQCRHRRSKSALSQRITALRCVSAHERYERPEREKPVGVYVSGYGGKADGKQLPIPS